MGEGKNQGAMLVQAEFGAERGGRSGTGRGDWGNVRGRVGVG